VSYCQGIQDILFQPSQSGRPTLQCCHNLIICHRLYFSGAGNWFKFTGTTFRYTEIADHITIRYELLILTTVEGDFHDALYEDISGPIDIGPTINNTEIRQINNQWEPDGIHLPIIVANPKVTPVIFSRSHS